MIRDASTDLLRGTRLRKAMYYLRLLPQVFAADLPALLLSDLIPTIGRRALFRARLDHGGEIAFRAADRGVLWEVFGERVYDRLRPRPGDTVVDLGAHIGAFTLFAAKRVGGRGRVVAVEPEPENAEILRRNVRRNRLKNVAVVEAALGAGHGIGRLYYSPFHGHTVSHSLHPVSDRAVSVRTVTLDSLCAEQGLTSISALKVDIEGAEVWLAQGAARMLPRTDRIVGELHEAFASGPDLDRELGRFGFRSSGLRRCGPVRSLFEARRLQRKSVPVEKGIGQ